MTADSQNINFFYAVVQRYWCTAVWSVQRYWCTAVLRDYTCFARQVLSTNFQQKNIVEILQQNASAVKFIVVLKQH